MSDHTAKRPRLTGSFSPASPPYHQLAKPRDQTKTVQQPNTPTSPPYLSMNTPSNVTSGTAATAPISEMTPPSSVHMSQPVSQSAAPSSNIPPFPTPNLSSSNIDSDGDARMADNLDDSHTHSNHDRKNRGALSGKGAAAGDRGASGSQLFKLCQSTHPVSRPHGSQNLFDLYGLSDLAQSVARTDPITGEKINKLRKSYEGHIKSMQIAGKPKAVKMEGALTNPMLYPDEEWKLQKVQGQEFEKAVDMGTGQLTANFSALLDKAFSGMAPGPLPPQEANRYRAYIGTDELLRPKEAPNKSIRTAASTPRPAHAASSEHLRPARAGAKRSYTDVAWQGYSEGFVDDSAGDDDERGGPSKKARLGGGGYGRTSHSVEVGGMRR